MMNDWGFGGWWGMGFGPVFMVLFWVLVIVGVVALIRSLQSRPDARDKTPAEIVQERYARGEINREEFEQKMRDLEGRR
jgi:putative membrane protein